MACQDSNRDGAREPIAIIGSGFRFPGAAHDPSKLWDLLLKPRDLLSKIPSNRFNADAFHHPDPSHHGTTDVKDSYFLEQDHRHFDANFFNIKPVEAHAIDPQQRLLMEVVYESLEASGMSIESLAGSQTGVYVGLMCADYVELLNSDINSLPTYTPTGNARSIMSNRISYFFDWHGPSMTIDTACSSSLVAVHQAVQLLRSGDSEIAIAAGANMILGPLQYVGASKLHMLSADSRCRMWDAAASGYARGEGVAAVVLKRLSTAIADGDTIECIIRESGVNQDGRTKGITMPSSAAQSDLIARTYARAGLDPRNPNDRCQYFEAHGTGTAAGDPKEAEAINESFFHPGEISAEHGNAPLYVGSIKTVIGHTEGTAGLAGLVKASLAIQHGVIPPNYLFNELHPAIEPFYTNLEIPTKAEPWPELRQGIPRRASVNSFGFGGTNAHVILEGYDQDLEKSESVHRQWTPFNFSAASHKSLRGVLADYLTYISSHPDVSLQNLSYTLYARRSEHSVRASVSASSASDLRKKIEELLDEDDNGNVGVRAQVPSGPTRILGIFTGQGAHWPTMGRELVRSSSYVKRVIEELDCVLQDLPEAERPSWSLMDELFCDDVDSGLASAVVAQPLCTVIQIILLDLLKSAGIVFEAVVGHSSGEIAAAYAAGYISRHDALKIAYYRGYFTKLADQPGGMMAVGTSMDDALELCRLPAFQGRLAIAAVNSADSMTLSGDLDAILEAREVLQDEQKFARVLKVDKAYHSWHMAESADAYAEALSRCNIELLSPVDGPDWYSSTFENRQMQADQDLTAKYWAANMVQPVLFSQALTSAARSACDVAIEVGPHPALKAPSLQSLEQEIPYIGLLQRGKDDVESFSNALGILWSHFAYPTIDFGQFDAQVSDHKHEKRRMINGLPRYHWDHEKLFWHGSRASRAVLQRNDPPNPLLGSRSSDIMDQELRWRNLLKLSELPWIRGHALQGQVVFPATAYIATAVEAVLHLVTDQDQIALIEVEDFALQKPLVFQEGDNGIETLFTLCDIIRESNVVTSASFTYHACGSSETEALSIHATGRVSVTCGDISTSYLSPRDSDLPNTVSIPADRFYASLEPLGYEYSGCFRTLSSIKRKLNFASAELQIPARDEEPGQMLVHPAVLDSALQGIFLAHSWPGDGSLEQLHVPTGIEKLRVNVPLCRQKLTPGTTAATVSRMTGNTFTTKQLEGDVDIYAEDGTGLVQFEGIRVVPFSELSASTDRLMFTEQKWGLASPDPELAMDGARATPEDYEYAYAMERVCIYYMKRVDTLFPKDTRVALDLPWHFMCLFDFFGDVLGSVRAGTRLSSLPAWLDDTEADLASLKARFGDRVDMRLAFAVGENLPAVIRGETTILEHMTKDNLLDRFYEVGLGLKEFSTHLSKTVKQIVHRHPRMRILEIGAGTGGATKMIMNDVGRSFTSYTYTDISTGFFETAQDVFSSYSDKMVFRTLNVENDIVEQGFEENSYDLIVASLVLHATSDLNRTLSNVRRLLKPGGYLVMTEVTNNDVSRVGFMMCALPGWWLGQNDGRKLSPCVSTTEWHELLLQNGFDGVNSSTPDLDSTPFPLAVIVSQAMDTQVSSLYGSLSVNSLQALTDEDVDFVIVGGYTLTTMRLIKKITDLIQPVGIRLKVFQSLVEIANSEVSTRSVVLCLTELDGPVFKRLSATSLAGLQKLLESEKTVLWVTQGSRCAEPYMNMAVGLGRTLRLENPDLALQFLDLEYGVKPKAELLLETLVRLHYGNTLAKSGALDKILWTNEHELAYEDGRLMVSRVYHSKDMNDRFNASRRTVLHRMNPRTVPIGLALDPLAQHRLYLDNHVSALMSNQSALKDSRDVVVVRTDYSLLTNTPDQAVDSLHLVVGTNMLTGESVVALTPNAGSYALVPSDKIAASGSFDGNNVQLLCQVHTHLQIDQLLSISRTTGTILIHEPSPEFAASISERAADTGSTVAFTTCSLAGQDGSWVKINPYSSKRAVRSSLPQDVSLFVDLSLGSPAQRSGALIASCLYQSCMCLSGADVQVSQYGKDLCVHQLEDALRRAKDSAAIARISLPLVSLDEVARKSDLSGPAIIDWSSATTVPVQLFTVDGQVSFRSDRTYVLFGLTSDLATSICDWMVSHGARNIVLTSRRPNIDSQWVELHARSAVRVEAIANDITDPKALRTLVSHIQKEWPPIAGVAHGAMVLDDVAFFEMPFEKMDKVLQPKVKGAMHLDDLFQDASLDFFVLFSSVTAIAGNRGQSAYSAANMYLSALATQRRKKGLAASILHIGAVMGVGYINRGYTDAVLAALRKTGFMMMSEREFHLCFAEAVLASHPLSERNAEVITALETNHLGENNSPAWSKFPQFQTCLMSDDGGEMRTKKKLAVASTRAQLVDASTPAEVLEVVSDALFSKLQVSLQLPADHDKAYVLASGTDLLGLDSLIAVEIRSWFLKEIDTDVPVFKILSGGSMAQLLDYAIQNMPATLTPNLTISSAAQAAVEQVIHLPNEPQREDCSVSGDNTTISQVSSQELVGQSTGMCTPTSSTTGFEKILALSPGQSRFWFLRDLLADQTTSNGTIWISVQGELDCGTMERAIAKVTQRHESLRTAFFTDEMQRPLQGIMTTSTLHLDIVSVSDESEVAKEFDKLKRCNYELERGDCMRLVYLSSRENSNHLLIGFHHIIMDGISLEVFLNDLQKAYSGSGLGAHATQYSDYTTEMREMLESGSMQEDVQYWKTELDPPPEPLPLLPFADASCRTTLTAYDSTSLDRLVSPALGARIQKICRDSKVNVFHFYLGVFEVLLHKLCGRSDICIGMADANRMTDETAGSIGMYLNLLPLLFNLDPEKSFSDVLKDTRRKAYLALAHSRLPFDVMLENVKLERSTTFTPLFQAFINYRQGVSEARHFADATASIKVMSLPQAGYDISLDIMENPGRDTRIVLMLQKSLYTDRHTELILDMYFKLLEDFSASWGVPIKDVSLHSAHDIDNAIHLGRGPIMHSSWPGTLVERIDQVIANNAERVAIIEVDGRSLTYQQLDLEADRIGSALLAAGVATRTVAVLQESSASLVCAMVAIMRYGAIYVPLDCTLPTARLRSMLAECRPAALLSSGLKSELLEELGITSSIPVIDITNLPNSASHARVMPLRPIDPAAVLFTSGTTGIPKAVSLSHASLANHVEAVSNMHGFAPGCVLQQSSIGFDMSLNQIFMALALGGSLVIVPEVLRKDFAAITQLILDYNISYTSATPSEYLAWLRHGSDSLVQCTTWRYATSGGEAFSLELFSAFRQLNGQLKHPLRVFNAYGPTETCMSASEIEVDLEGTEWRHISAGSALANVAIYVMDDYFRPLPVGFVGEICIAGAGVAIEYLHNPESSVAKFLRDPNASSFARQRGWDRIYRTGDNGFLRPDGTLDILGRIDGDTQIKLRGMRIELRDIEHAILESGPGLISEVVVTTRGNPAIIVAHVVMSSDTATSDVTGYLRQLTARLALPPHMRPAAIVPVPSLPLTPSGKVDRRAVEKMSILSDSPIRLTPVLTPRKAKIAQLWKQILPQQTLDAHIIDEQADFFQVGGNSMLVIQLRELLNEEFQVHLTLMQLFQHSSLGAMALAIDDLSADRESIDWRLETDVPVDYPRLSLQSPLSRNSHMSVLLTGATGFLGKALLQQLDQEPSVDTIYCIAVRSRHKLSQFAASQKIKVYDGDLAQPRCGLSQAEADFIFNAVDVIIHNGADVSFLKRYCSLKASNLTSTKELIKLAVPRGITFHFVSTASVGKLKKSDVLAPESLASCTPTESVDGYAASKWASEVFLEKVHAKYELPTFIHRPSSISGDGSGDDDIVSSVLKFASIIQALPDTSRWTGYIDLISVEKAASGIVGAVLQDQPIGYGVQYRHHAGEKVIPAREIADHLTSGQEAQWSVLPMHAWVDQAISRGMNPLVGEYLRSVDQGGSLQIGQKLLSAGP